MVGGRAIHRDGGNSTVTESTDDLSVSSANTVSRSPAHGVRADSSKRHLSAGAAFGLRLSELSALRQLRSCSSIDRDDLPNSDARSSVVCDENGCGCLLFS